MTSKLSLPLRGRCAAFRPLLPLCGAAALALGLSACDEPLSRAASGTDAPTLFAAADAGAPLAQGALPYWAAQVSRGTVATVAGVMGGPLPLRYQWRRDGEAIAGATQEHLMLSGDLRADDRSHITVLITDGAGQAIIRPAALALLPQPIDSPQR